MPNAPLAQSEIPPGPSITARRGRAFAAWIILLVGAGLFIQRGVVRGLDGSWDFTMIYAGALQLVAGQDPYVFEDTFEAFEAAGGKGRARDRTQFAVLYPPFTYAILAPLGLMPWAAAKATWLAINVLGTAAVGAWLIRHRPGRRSLDVGAGVERAAWWPIAMALGLWLGCASLHTAVAFGQLSIVPLALMLPALRPWSSRPGVESWPWRSTRTAGLGLMLAVAGAIKPQLVVLLAALLLATPRWRLAVWSLGWAIGIAATAALWVQVNSPDWLANWGEQLTFFTESGQASPTLSNPYTYQMINLEPWLHRLWPDGAGPIGILGSMVLAVSLVGCVAIGAVLGISQPRRGVAVVRNSFRNRWVTDDFLLLAVALMAVITLLSDYHRTYDAVLLILPALWVWRRLHLCPGDVWAWVMAGALASFMLPGPVILTTFARQGRLPAGLTDSWVWQAWLLPHHNIALLVLAVALCVRFFRRSPLPAK